MASDKTLKFYKGASAPSSAVVGSVWFDTANRLINVKVATSGENQWEAYSGLQNATWDETNKILNLVTANGEILPLTFKDVASAAALTLVTNRVTAVEEWKATADGDITTLKGNVTDLQTAEGKNTAKLADIEEGKTVKAVIDAAVLVEKERAEAIEGDHETRIANLETTVGNHGEAIEALQEIVGAAESLEDAISDAIGKFNTDVVEPGLAAKADKATYEAYVKSNDEALAGVKATAEGEVSRAQAAEEAIQADLDAVEALVDTLVGAKNENGAYVDAGKSVRTIASEEVAAIVADAPEAYDTLKEIADWISAHPTDAADYNRRITANETAIATLNGDDKTAGSVAKAVKDAKDEIYGEITANEETTAAALTNLNERVAGLEELDLANKVSDFESRIVANETAVSTVDSRIGDAKTEVTNALKGDVETLDTLGKLEDAVNAVSGDLTTLAGEAVKSVTGGTPSYITVSGDQEVTVSAVMGNVGDDALITGKKVQEYVDAQIAASWLWEEFA